MIWCTIEVDYISYLKKFDSRIPDIDYGDNGYKPFFSPLFEIDNLVYVSQISSKKERHLKLKENLDFIKLYDKSKKNLIAVINLNYMFPVPKDEIIEVKYEEIEKFREFKSENEKSKYIDLLRYEMKLIKDRKIEIKAKKLYDIIDKKEFLKKRCLDFKMLEKEALKWNRG